ncbi:MAG: hypothetical protein KME26_25780 [Oscillatoria princeps RMCB-10]|nr:hypothetical protein [Oscillatoria princeps RMCB-10]
MAIPKKLSSDCAPAPKRIVRSVKSRLLWHSPTPAPVCGQAFGFRTQSTCQRAGAALAESQE